jgi:ribose 5-phosphate isomerase RpiB
MHGENLKLLFSKIVEYLETKEIQIFSVYITEGLKVPFPAFVLSLTTSAYSGTCRDRVVVACGHTE